MGTPHNLDPTTASDKQWSKALINRGLFFKRKNINNYKFTTKWKNNYKCAVTPASACFLLFDGCPKGRMRSCKAPVIIISRWKPGYHFHDLFRIKKMKTISSVRKFPEGEIFFSDSTVMNAELEGLQKETGLHSQSSSWILSASWAA